MKQNKTMGCIAITGVAIIYGVSYLSRDIIVKEGGLPPTVVTLLQLAIMAGLFLIYNLITKKSLKLTKKDVPIIVLSGVFGTFLFHTLTNMSMATKLDASIPSLLFGLAAVFSLVINAVIFKKKTNALSWIAVVVGLIGLAVVMELSPANFQNIDVVGYLLCIGSVLAWVIYCFMSDVVPGTYEKTVILFWQAFVGVLCCLPFALTSTIDTVKVSNNLSTVILHLIILGLFNATIAYFLNIYAIKQIGVNMANIFLNFMPIATMVALFVLKGVVPSISKIVGCAIIIASVLLLGVAEKKLAAAEK